MRMRFHNRFLQDYAQWKVSRKSVLIKIDTIIENIKINPMSGIGKPEKLKYSENIWSRRITKKDRLVYEICDDKILLLSCRGHYDF